MSFQVPSGYRRMISTALPLKGIGVPPGPVAVMVQLV